MTAERLEQNGDILNSLFPSVLLNQFHSEKLGEAAGAHTSKECCYSQSAPVMQVLEY